MFLLIAVLLAGVWYVYQVQQPQVTETASEAFTAVTLEYVVDGDTIYVTQDGNRVKIRLIGIDTPESVSETKPNTEEGEAASEYVRNLLPVGTPLYLEYDETTYDKYGRTLAYVWLSADANAGSYDDFCKYNLSAVIYQNTYCSLLNIPPNDKYEDWFEELTPWEKK